jgi:hypothetical protein
MELFAKFSHGFLVLLRRTLTGEHHKAIEEAELQFLTLFGNFRLRCACFTIVNNVGTLHINFNKPFDGRKQGERSWIKEIGDVRFA